MKKKVKNKLRNVCILVVDKSSSISTYGLTDSIINYYNYFVNDQKRLAEEHNQEVLVGLVTFADNAHPVLYPVPAEQVRELNRTTYIPHGMTALNDGVGMAIEMAEPYENDKDTAILIKVITDGEENQSKTWKYKLPETIRQKQDLGNWTFVYEVPHGKKFNLNRNFNIPLDNINEWEATIKGVVETQSMTSLGLSNYYTARSAGARSVKNFYEVDVDLSDLNTKKLKSELEDLSPNFKTFQVDKEMPIRSFIESKGYLYFIGCAYYQLSKKELVQGNKQILVCEKGKKQVWGGDKARQLVGLPTDGSDAYVEPYNLGDKNLYIASTSTNRKLVRGTTLLFDFKVRKNKVPTWVDPDFATV